ncbi:hypothetical protein RHGRI_032431 [Rhododendron griersonianum]|uniref:Integrase catalytic domain-containing protein n=1 Tax=Rhododendron griersonianum TaxID=479676 RepID=A0AAV6ICD5_9ERIC|nr:hypothetical protein RHGRI_032431 [Rhododendron griersonianum]
MGKTQMHCDYCDLDNHNIDTCYKLHGYPTDKPRNSRRNPSHSNSLSSGPSRANDRAMVTAPMVTQEQYNKILAMLSSGSADFNANLAGIALYAPSFSAWIIDTGASNHMCSSLSLFSSYKPCPNPSFVQLPDGSDAKITHIGTVVLSPDLQLDNVFYIPSFKFNLLSVSQLTNSHQYSVVFLRDRCIFQDLSAKRTIGLGSVHGNLYYLQASSANLVTGTPTIDIWHWRLGHPSHHRMSELAKNVSSISYSPLHVCDICPQAKQTRLCFPHSSISTNKPFQLIHVDIWGSFSKPSMSGARFFFTIVDDFSRCTWIYLMCFKSDMKYHLKSFFSMVKTQYHCQIKHIFSGQGEEFLPEIQQIRSDNGSEFLSNEMQHFFF